MQRVLRFGLFAALGFFAGALFLYFVPDAVNGPFADYDSFNSGLGLDTISEATPLINTFRINPYQTSAYFAAAGVFLRLLFLPLLAFAVLIFNARKQAPQTRALYFAHGAYLLAAILLTLFWELRVVYFMQLFTLAPLTGLLGKTFDAAERKYDGIARVLAKTAVFLALGPLPVLLLPAAFGKMPMRDLVLFPAARQESACSLKNASAFLARPSGYGNRTHTILAAANDGPELLFRTPHNVVASNYNVAGNVDVFEFFDARDDRAAKNIARKWHADLVLVCRNIPSFYAGMDRPRLGKNLFLTAGKDGKLRFVSNPEYPSLIERLAAGTPPPWLKPVEIPIDNDYLLYAFQEKAKQP